MSLLLLALPYGGDPLAQSISQRGFVEGSATAFPQAVDVDPTHVVGDLLAREEVFFRPWTWLRLAGGLELRANSHDQVEAEWRVDISDRGIKRPWLSVRSVSATATHGALTIEAGKQFIRWGKTDIIAPMDRFSPRDYLTVVEAPFIGVTGVRGAVQAGAYAIEAVWVPRFTPSRVPLVDQRWTIRQPETAGIPITETQPTFPDGSQTGIRVGRTGSRLDFSLTFYDGFNHLPNIRTSVPVASTDFTYQRLFPPIRMYGGDMVAPLRWFTLKAEAAYFTSPSIETDQYAQYVVEAERQRGEWLFLGGYVGESVTRYGTTPSFAPDRGLSRAIVGRASYTFHANRRIAFETAVRRNGDGVFAKVEFSQARGAHWRTTLTAIVIGGQQDDFFGQYRHNSHGRLDARYSY